MPRFNASRGGVRLIPPPQLSDVSGAVGTWEMATDVTPGLSTKAEMSITCSNPIEVSVGAVTTTLKVGNFRQLYWSEQVDAWTRQLQAKAARVAEQRLLANMESDAGTTLCHSDVVVGAARDVVDVVGRAAAGYRSRLRLDDGEFLTFIAPNFLKAFMRADLSRGAFVAPYELAITDAQIDAMFVGRGISPVGRSITKLSVPKRTAFSTADPAQLTRSCSFQDHGSFWTAAS